jgi:hypothetical protein
MRKLMGIVVCNVLLVGNCIASAVAWGKETDVARVLKSFEITLLAIQEQYERAFQKD